MWDFKLGAAFGAMQRTLPFLLARMLVYFGIALLYKSMLRNAVWLWLFMWLLTLAIFLVMIGPAFALMALIPGDLGFWALVIAFILAWSVKMALIEPLALFAYLQIYLQGIEGQTPDPVWDQRLADASETFRQLKNRALNPS